MGFLSGFKKAFSGSMTVDEAVFALGIRVLHVAEATTGAFLQIDRENGWTSSQSPRPSKLEVETDYYCLYCHFVHRTAVRILGPERRSQLTEKLFPGLASYLADKRFTGSEERYAHWRSLMIQMDEFSEENMHRELITEEKEGMEDTVLCKFAKRHVGNNPTGRMAVFSAIRSGLEELKIPDLLERFDKSCPSS